MRRPNWSFTIAICVSLGLHAWLIHASVVRGWGMGQGGWGATNKWDAHRYPKLPTEKKWPPLEVVKLPRQQAMPKLEDQFGQPDQHGQAINSMSGDKPLRGRQSEDEQASLSRHPGEHREGEAAKAKVSNVHPTANLKQGGDNGAAAKMLAALEPRQQTMATPMVGVALSKPAAAAAAAEALGVTKPAAKPFTPSHDQPAEKSPQQDSVVQHPQQATKAQTPQPARKAMVAAGSGGGTEAGHAAETTSAQSGDPGEKSDSDSDLFSHTGSVVFQAGRLEARFGRKFRSARPNFTLSGRMDLANMYDPSVQLELHVDSNGKPTQVEVIRSSGSNNIDEPVRLSMYDWWFEPPKDRNGKPKADVLVWSIFFR